MSGDTMCAWVVDEPGPIDSHPLRRIERATPEPMSGQLLIEVSACGVCSTDLHLAEGDLLPSRHRRHSRDTRSWAWWTASGRGASRCSVGDRVGVPWLAPDLRSVPVLPVRPGEPLP